MVSCIVWVYQKYYFNRIICDLSLVEAVTFLTAKTQSGVFISFICLAAFVADFLLCEDGGIL